MSQDDKPSDRPTGPTTSAGPSSEAELAQAFRELSRGEQQAAAMEANLTKLEDKLDALLAQFEAAAPPEQEDGGDGNAETVEKTSKHV
ncbi:putative EKC/KEOPS complex subunit GON7 [Seiridium cardinale]